MFISKFMCIRITEDCRIHSVQNSIQSFKKWYASANVQNIYDKIEPKMSLVLVYCLLSEY